MSDPLRYGLLAEFEDAESLVHAAHDVTERGYRHVDAFAPFPVHHLAEALGFHRSRMSLVVLVGAICGLVGGYGMQYWMAAVDYPLNIGGRPAHSWPAFIPVTFELTILAAALSAVLGMLALNGLPRPHHPLFAIDAFKRANQDGFFLCIESTDPMFDEAKVRDLLRDLHAKEVWDVAADA